MIPIDIDIPDSLLARARLEANVYQNRTGKVPNIMFMPGAPKGLKLLGMVVCDGNTYCAGYCPELANRAKADRGM